jgi:hypothetical protein
MTPDADQKEHRNNLYLPEQIEEKEIRGEEDAHNGSFHQEQKEMERSDSYINLFPRDKDTENGEKAGQEDEHQADAVQPEAVTNSKGFDPRMILSEQPSPGGPGVPLKVQCEERRYDEEIRQRHPEARPPAKHWSAGKTQR